MEQIMEKITGGGDVINAVVGKRHAECILRSVVRVCGERREVRLLKLNRIQTVDQLENAFLAGGRLLRTNHNWEGSRSKTSAV